MEAHAPMQYQFFVPLPAHFQWYYLTNFRSPTDAKKFVEKYDAGEMGLTEWDREPYEVEG